MATPAFPAIPDASYSDLIARLWTRDLAREHGFEPLVVEGKLPRELRGTLYRNGPGLFGQFGTRYTHPFEADGAVTAIRLDGGRATGASKVTPSAGLVEEREAEKMLYGLAVSWPRRLANGLRGRFKNTANTNVMAWQGRLFALMEAGRPTELDPRDLAMIGETDLGGAVGAMFSAHPHRVASRKAIYNFGLEYGRKTKLHMYELPDAGAARHLGAIELAGPPMLHDFIATDTHLVFFVSPVRVSVPRILLQIGGFEDMFQWRPQHGTEIICVPIDRPSEPVRFTVDPFYQWHFANAYVDRFELVIDYVHYPTFDSFYEIGGFAKGTAPNALAEARYHRARIDLVNNKLRDECVFDRMCEFPTVAPGVEGRTHQVTYLVLDELGAIGKLDLATGGLDVHVLPASQRASEPVFVPRAHAIAEDDGHVLSLCADAATDRAFLAVYEAKRIAAGPVARVWLDHSVPITFHGTFMAGVV
jgi:all-trans-8'-apo-beta-carotenal 15,15'-oxygenase